MKHKGPFTIGVAFLMLCPSLGQAAEVTPSALSLGAFSDVGYLGSPGANGAAFTVGLRATVSKHWALGFDFGYGLLSAADSAAQDRWWLMPSVALVIPVSVGPTRATFDLGAGAGLGTSSGYASWSDYFSEPFMPAWKFQLAPAGRIHAIAALQVRPAVDVYLRADAAALLLPPQTDAGAMSTTWLMFSVGTRFRLL